MKFAAITIAVVLAILPQCAIAQELGLRSSNFLHAIARPVEQQDTLTKEIVQRLIASEIRTPKDAESFGGILDARSKAEVTGLYVSGVDVAGFANRGDLFWEVTVSIIGVQVTRVVWVSASTRAVRVVFPFSN